MRRILRVVGSLLGVVVLVVAGFLAWATVSEYKPGAVEFVTPEPLDGEVQPLGVGGTVTALTFNVGYAALGEDQDFFMDGGDMVRPPESAVQANLKGLDQVIKDNPAQVAFLQEVDVDSRRSYGVDQRGPLADSHYANQAFAYNFKSLFTPYPLEPIGQVESGLMTMTTLDVIKAQRRALPVPFAWPVRLFNLKRCLLVERVPVEGGKELVLVNFHLEAYESGAGRAEQLKRMMDFMEAEYAKGNYVLAGGDFNHNLPGADYPLIDSTWEPGKLAARQLPEGWVLANDPKAATARLLNGPYTGDDATTQLFGIDGYVLSPNLELGEVETLDLAFKHSDHNPVRLTATLKG
jgi:endonuclease/exonuclease/phosphatase family metal-dependent hydrolase